MYAAAAAGEGKVVATLEVEEDDEVPEVQLVATCAQGPRRRGPAGRRLGAAAGGVHAGRTQ
eukprot:3284881-Lingulodinium_polyedra.AAC.1